MSSPPNSIPLSLMIGPTHQPLPLPCCTSCTGSLEPTVLDLAGLAPPRMQETRRRREEGEDVPRVGRRGSRRPKELPCAARGKQRPTLDSTQQRKMPHWPLALLCAPAQRPAPATGAHCVPSTRAPTLA